MACKQREELEMLKDKLSSELEMKDLSPATRILGMHMIRDRDSRTLFLSQTEYVEKVLNRFKMKDSKPISTPLGAHFKLSKQQEPKDDAEVEFMKKIPYSSAVGYYKSLRKLYVLVLDGVTIRDGSKFLKAVGSFPSLKTISLKFSNFTGTVNGQGEVPIQSCWLKEPQLIDLSNNNLFGEIPSCLDNTSLHNNGYNDGSSTSTLNRDVRGTYSVGSSTMDKVESLMFTTKETSYSYKGKPLNKMYGIDLSCNKLVGEIPPQIGKLTRVRALNLSHNNLTGVIPVTFSNLN
ncbi:receptor-like protein 15 [Citrus sinensis]|uniref:receptor-like protein 15 n=1 Tax=Citrus sinensis TaxID=2711 RepID=UPI00227812B3|nr:receptor-like protein 15 [Citrus sinensis]